MGLHYVSGLEIAANKMIRQAFFLGGLMSLKILIVEDNPDWEVVWRLIIDVFAEAAEIVWATSVVEAERHIGNIQTDGVKFDIIVSDIFLSGSFTGFDLYNHLDPIYKKRFLFVSSVKASKVNALLKAENNEIRVLQKPFGIKQAVAEMRSILKKEGYRPPQIFDEYVPTGI